jgi:short-subunit dehydrogenase
MQRNAEPILPAGAPPTPAEATHPFVVVTGGSEGIGLAIALEFARRRHRILIVARDAGRLAAAARLVAEAGATETATLALDLTAPGALAGLDRRLEALGGHVDVLVNNAAMGHCGPFSGISDAELDAIIALNVALPARLMRHVLPGMQRRGRGGVLNIASLGGYLPGPWQAVYYASKAMLVSLSEAVAAEVRADGVRVCVAVPGPVETRFHDKMGAGRALYRQLVPAARARGVAALSVLAYEAGVKVVAPGILTLFGLVACRLLPHALLVPLMSVLLKPRSLPQGGAAGNA